LINVTFPSESQLKRIYGTLINQKLADFEEEIKPLGDLMVQATIDLYNAVCTFLLPIPSRSHYIFNLRDMSKVFQGLLLASRDKFDSAEAMIKLWVHECFRVFHDRLVDEKDRAWFRGLVSDKLSIIFNVQWNKVFKSNQISLFGDFMSEEPKYAEMPPSELDQVKTRLMEYLEEYNVDPLNPRLDLVFFRDAIEHLCRIHRIIRQPRGNALLVGVGGSGRSSLVRLAAFMCGYKVFTIEIRKNFRESDFHDKLKDLYRLAGIDNKPTVFLFNDTQIKNISFLEDISNILSRGEVPNLYDNDEMAQIRDAMRNQEGIVFLRMHCQKGMRLIFLKLDVEETW